MYGIWNNVTKRFVFGIREETPIKALRAFRKKVPERSYYWRYDARKIPEGFKNPPNPLHGKAR